MAAGIKYTEEQRNYITDNFGSLSTGDIAAHIGTSAGAIRKWAAMMRKGGYAIIARKAAIGEQRRNWCRIRGAWITREKLPNGRWKFISYESPSGRISGPKERPVGTISHRKNGRTYEKTETGWKFKGIHSADGRKQAEGRPSKYKPGDVSVRMHEGQKREFVKQEDGRWKIKPLQFVTKRVKKSVVVKNKPVKPLVRTDERKRSIDHTKNPDKVKIKDQEGGQWVRIDAKTVVYRKNIAS